MQYYRLIVVLLTIIHIHSYWKNPDIKSLLFTTGKRLFSDLDDFLSTTFDRLETFETICSVAQLIQVSRLMWPSLLISRNILTLWISNNCQLTQRINRKLQM